MDFDERRRRKYAAGRRERGLPLDGSVFIGDPCEEGREECVDLANYAEQAVLSGQMPAQVGQEILEKAYAIDMAFRLFSTRE